MQSQFDMSKKFFELPLEVKQALPFDVYLDIGYQAPKSQSLDPDRATQKTADTKVRGLLVSDRRHAPAHQSFHLPVGACSGTYSTRRPGGSPPTPPPPPPPACRRAS